MVQYYPYHMNNNIFFIRSIFYNYSTGLPGSRFSMHGMGMSWSWHAWHGRIDAHRIAARRARPRLSEFRRKDYGSAGEKIGNRKKTPTRKSADVVPRGNEFLGVLHGPIPELGGSDPEHTRLHILIRSNIYWIWLLSRSFPIFVCVISKLKQIWETSRK